jgi:hypothetical protein
MVDEVSKRFNIKGVVQMEDGSSSQAYIRRDIPSTASVLKDNEKHKRNISTNFSIMPKSHENPSDMEVSLIKCGQTWQDSQALFATT